jgi:hypothetical protein
VYLTPRGDHIYGYTHCLTNNYGYIVLCFFPNVFLWLFYVIKRSKLVSYWDNTNIWGIFCQNWGVWPPGVTCIVLPPVVSQLILKNYYPSMSYICYIIKGSKLTSNLHNKGIWCNFLSKIGYLTPGVTLWQIMFNKYYHALF